MKAPTKKQNWDRWKDVKVYEQRRGNRTVYIVKWYSSKGQRESLSFSDPEKAAGTADIKQAAIDEGLKASEEMTGDDLREYQQCVRRLPKGITIQNLIDGYFLGKPLSVHHSTVTVKKAVDEYVNKLKELYEQNQKSKFHYKSTEYRLKSFVKKFGREPIGTMTTPMLEEYFNTIPNPTTRRNRIITVCGLFNFAQIKDYFPREAANPASKKSIERPTTNKKTKDYIFTPDEMIRLLAFSQKKLLSWFVIGGFVGVRTEERARMTWEAYLEEAEVFRLDEDITKTNRTRQPTITNNVDAWLPLIRRKDDMAVTEYYNPHREKKPVLKKAKVTWRNNALRHSYGSYYCELTGDLKTASKNAGHSEDTLKGKYEHLVTKKEAKEWFDITPESVVRYCIKHEFPMPEWATEEIILAAKKEPSETQKPPATKKSPVTKGSRATKKHPETESVPTANRA